MEHAVLVARGEPPEQRQDLDRRGEALGEHVRGLADLALARQEHQHVARSLADQLLERFGDGVLLRPFFVGVVLVDGAPADLDRPRAPGHLDDRRAAEVRRERLGVDGRRRDDDAQVAPLLDQALEIPDQEVDVEAALVRLVQDDGVVLPEPGIALHLGQQDAVGHQLDRGAGLGLVGEADLVADVPAERRAELLRDALGHGARRDAPRLGVADPLGAPPPHRETDLGDLRGLPRTGLAAHDRHRVILDGARDLVPLLPDREILRDRNRWDRAGGGRARRFGGAGRSTQPCGLNSRTMAMPPAASTRPRKKRQSGIVFTGWK
jgi:hypothetical protein